MRLALSVGGVVAVGVAVVVGASVLGACSDSGAPSGDSDGAVEGGVQVGDAGPEAGIVLDAAVPDGACAVPTTVDPFCRAFSCPGDGCNPTVACQQGRLDQCANVMAAESATFRSATVDCTASVACTDLLKFDDCVFGRLEAAPRDDAQTLLASDYCKACPGDAGPGCASAFYARDSQLGLALLVYGDAILTEIDQTCLPSQCGTGFVDCALNVANARVPAQPKACQ